MTARVVDTAFTCHNCPATITVFGPRTNAHADASLRRVDWTRDDRVVTCRRCRKKGVLPVLELPEPESGADEVAVTNG